MTELIISIAASSLLFFIFRLFPKYGVDTSQAIIVNYFTAFLCGCIVSGEIPSVREFAGSGIIYWTLFTGILLISLFIGMGISSYKNGVGVTSVAVKMSLALSVIFMIVVYSEPVTIVKIAGVIVAVTGIILITAQPESSGKRSVLLLLFLFAGSSVLDLVLNHVQKHELGNYPSSLYTAFGFLAAGCFGLIWMITEYVRKKRIFSWRNVIGGIVLGIPNYFSLYFLVRSYRTTGWTDSETLAVTGISVVALSAVFGMIIFRESAGYKKIAGLILSIAAIVLLTLI